MSVRPSFLLLSCSLASCVGYSAAEADLPQIAAEVAERPGGAFSIEASFARALAQNPELLALEAEARAAGAETTVPLPLVGEVRGRSEAFGLMVDPVALLGLGPRGAAIDTADARLAAAVSELAAARWRVLASVAECHLVDAALAEWSAPDLDLDVEAFAVAGLASAVARAGLEAARAEGLREEAAWEQARRDNLTRARRLLGLDASTPLVLEPIDPQWLEQPSGEPAELLVRPDLALATARFEVADARFREAVAAQYPTFQIGPNLSWRGDPLRAMGMLQIPLGMGGLAEAARERREVARIQLVGAYLTAQEEAALADERLAKAEVHARAVAAQLEMARLAFTAARVGLEVEPDAFERFTETAGRLVRALRDERMVLVEIASARVRRAEAWGWPRPAAPEGSTESGRSEP